VFDDKKKEDHLKNEMNKWWKVYECYAEIWRSVRAKPRIPNPCQA